MENTIYSKKNIMQHPIDPAIDFNSIRDAIESMLVGRDQLVDDIDMQNILIAILEYSRQQRAVCQNPYINNATNTWYVYDSNGNPYDTNVSAEGTIIRQTEAQSIEGDPRVTLAQIDPMKPNEMKMTIYIPKGERGESGSVVTIVDGYWYIDGVNTGVVATGEAPTISEDGYWVVGGEKTEFKAVGTDGRDGVDGQNGADGYSPTATVVKTGNTATIEITDKNGTTTATISDGTNGTDGQDGEDGFSPVVEVIQGDNSATINITDKTGQHSATISGLDGSYVPLYSTEKDWENRANWGNHYRVLMYGREGALYSYNTRITPLYMCPKYTRPKLVTYEGNFDGKCYKIESSEVKQIEPDMKYVVKCLNGGSITYNNVNYGSGDIFTGSQGVSTYAKVGDAKVDKISQTSIKLLCSSYKKESDVIRVINLNNNDYVDGMNGWISIDKYEQLYSQSYYNYELSKIKYVGNEDVILQAEFNDNMGTNPHIGPFNTNGGDFYYGKYELDENGAVVDNEEISWGHLFPLRPNRSYLIRIMVNGCYEALFEEKYSPNTNISENVKYIVGSGDITYNNTTYSKGQSFIGVAGETTYTTSNNGKVYEMYMNPLDNNKENCDSTTETSKPWKYECRVIRFSTDNNAKIINDDYNTLGNLMENQEEESNDGDWNYGSLKIYVVRGEIFFCFIHNSTDRTYILDYADIYGKWENVTNEYTGDTTKGFFNFTLLLDVVENDLTQVTTNNDSPAIEQE